VAQKYKQLFCQSGIAKIGPVFRIESKLLLADFKRPEAQSKFPAIVTGSESSPGLDRQIQPLCPDPVARQRQNSAKLGGGAIQCELRKGCTSYSDPNRERSRAQLAFRAKTG